jgi:hypothetical protein
LGILSTASEVDETEHLESARLDSVTAAREAVGDVVEPAGCRRRFLPEDDSSFWRMVMSCSSEVSNIFAIDNDSPCVRFEKTESQSIVDLPVLDCQDDQRLA